MTLFNPVFNCLTPIVIRRSKTQADEGLTPADEAGSVVLRQPPAGKLANLFRIAVRDHALGLVTQHLGGRAREHPPGGSLLKQHPGRDSLAMKRRSSGWSEDFMLEVPNAAEPQPKRMSKNGVLPPEWGWFGSQPGGERHEDAVALRRQVYQPDRRRALVL